MSEVFDAEEVEGVFRYYEQMLKKQSKRLRSLDARGAPEEDRKDRRRSIRKYEIVLEALTHYQSEELK